MKQPILSPAQSLSLMVGKVVGGDLVVTKSLLFACHLRRRGRAWCSRCVWRLWGSKMMGFPLTLAPSQGGARPLGSGPP